MLLFSSSLALVCEALQAWSVEACVSKDDWLDWLRRFSLKLLSESPYASLKACAEVALNHYPLARSLVFK